MPDGPLGLFAGNAFVELFPEASKFAAEAKAEVSKAASGIEGEASKAFAGVGRAATFAVVGAAVAIGAASIEMADKFEASHARLETALHNIGDSWGNERKQVDALDASMGKLAFTNTDTQSALAKLLPATHNTSTAITQMHLAADIARGRNIDLASATDLLVKVDAGRYTQLTRLGILTKEQAANIHSAADATRILGQVYGGNAAAYVDTFAGKMDKLKVESENLAKNIGLRLIPVVETLATDGLAAVDWLEKHKVAAAALGVVIGGPLVAAMATYVALQTKALAENVAGFFGGLASAATSVIAPIVGATGAIEAETAVLTPAAYEAELYAAAAAHAAAANDALAGSAAAAEIAAGGVGLATAAAATGGLALLAGGIYLLNRGKNETAAADQRWADSFVSNAVKAGNATKSVAAEQDNYKRKVDELRRDRYQYIDGRTDGEWQREYGIAKGHLDALSGAWKKHEADVAKAAKDAAKDHAAASAAIEGNAAAASQAATAEGKAMVKAVTDLTASVGPNLAQIDQAYGLTSGQIEAFAKHVDSMKTSMANSFNSTTDVVAAFAGKTDISFKDVNKFLQNSVTEARNWADNIKKLSADGVNNGLLETLEQAGPKSAPLVTALLNDVKAGGVGVINQAGTDAQTILSDLQTFMANQANGFLLAGAADGAAYAAGFNSAMSHVQGPGLTSGTPHAKALPKFAAGGFIDHPQVLLAGEKSRREVILPLEDKARSFELLAQSGLFDGSTAANGRAVGALTASPAAAAGPTFIANGVIGNKAAVARWMREAFSEHFGGASPHNRPVWANGTAER